MPHFVVNKASSDSRADSYVAAQYPQFSRSALKSLFAAGKVVIHGGAVKGGQKLKIGQKVSVDSALLEAEPQSIKLPIIYEDDAVIVINKPAGILTHAKGALNIEPTVASFLKDRLSDKELTGNRAGIVHRLDRATSGVLIGAKSAKTQAWLQKQFSTRKVDKNYVAIVEGRPKQAAALIDAPIGRNPKKRQSFKIMASGKSAQTGYTTEKVFKKKGQEFSLLKLNPVTGRTHQIRIHLAYIGHPVVGDSLYGHNHQRLLLHAKGLTITLPDGRRRTFSAPLPPAFKEFMA